MSRDDGRPEMTVPPDNRSIVLSNGFAVAVVFGPAPGPVTFRIARCALSSATGFEFCGSLDLRDAEARELSAILLRGANHELPEGPTGWDAAR